MGYRVAVVGATGNVGREVLNILAERKFPADEVIALASSRSIGREISYGDKILKAKNLDDFDFKGVDFAIMSAGGAISRDWAPRIAASGCIVIDNSSYWRYHSDIPLVVPEVNGAVLDRWLADPKRGNIIANPN
jgi:aspartate-semialdehyde dehydrogenase